MTGRAPDPRSSVCCVLGGGKEEGRERAQRAANVTLGQGFYLTANDGREKRESLVVVVFRHLAAYRRSVVSLALAHVFFASQWRRDLNLCGWCCRLLV